MATVATVATVATNRNPWHYPRPEVAQSLLRLLESRVTPAETVFGPRRMGKTEFLLQDFAPLAEARGHKVVYLSLWEAEDAPLALLVRKWSDALMAAPQCRSLAAPPLGPTPPPSREQPPPSLRSRGGCSMEDRVLHAAKEKRPARIAGSAAGFGGSIEFAKRQGDDNELILLDDLIERVVGHRKRGRRGLTILVMDEAQELAARARDRRVVAALRSSLDKRIGSLASVFAGSDRRRLEAMFADRRAPFFRFGSAWQLPELPDDFAIHMANRLREAADVSLSPHDAIAAFNALDRNPYVFHRHFLHRLIEQPDAPLALALASSKEVLAGVSDRERTWRALTPLQQRVAMRIAALRGNACLYHKESREALGRELGVGAIAKSSVQAALRRLERLGVVAKDDDGWRIADDGLRAWLAHKG